MVSSSSNGSWNEMCEYCGCQALAAVAELTAEHDAVVALVAQVRAALGSGRTDDAAALCRSISAVMGPHTYVEERGLFPALADSFPDHVEALTAEHGTIERVLAEAAWSTPVDPGWPERLLRTLDLLRQHILKEQDGVFPAALAELSPQQWDSIDKVRAEAGAPAASGAAR